MAVLPYRESQQSPMELVLPPEKTRSVRYGKPDGPPTLSSGQKGSIQQKDSGERGSLSPTKRKEDSVTSESAHGGEGTENWLANLLGIRRDKRGHEFSPMERRSDCNCHSEGIWLRGDLISY